MPTAKRPPVTPEKLGEVGDSLPQQRTTWMISSLSRRAPQLTSCSEPPRRLDSGRGDPDRNPVPRRLPTLRLVLRPSTWLPRLLRACEPWGLARARPNRDPRLGCSLTTIGERVGGGRDCRWSRSCAWWSASPMPAGYTGQPAATGLVRVRPTPCVLTRPYRPESWDCSSSQRSSRARCRSRLKIEPRIRLSACFLRTGRSTWAPGG